MQNEEAEGVTVEPIAEDPVAHIENNGDDERSEYEIAFEANRARGEVRAIYDIEEETSQQKFVDIIDRWYLPLDARDLNQAVQEGREHDHGDDP